MQDEERGIALLAYSSEDNRVMHISALTPDYTHVTTTYTKIFTGLGREAPAMFKHGDVYLMATSGCSGWEPNQLEVFWTRSAFQIVFMPACFVKRLLFAVALAMSNSSGRGCGNKLNQ